MENNQDEGLLVFQETRKIKSATFRERAQICIKTNGYKKHQDKLVLLIWSWKFLIDFLQKKRNIILKNIP